MFSVLKMEIDGTDIQLQGTRIKSPVSSNIIMNTTSVLLPTEGTLVNPILTLKHMLWRLILKVFLKLESNFSCFTIHSIIACFIGTVSEDIPNQDAKQCCFHQCEKKQKGMGSQEKKEGKKWQF